MNYRTSDPYPTKYHGRLKEIPSILVMHTTEGGSKTWLDTAFSGRDPSYKLSVHWCVYADGEIVEYAPWKPGEAVACWHAGESLYHSKPSCNYWSLGYEMQHAKGDPYPEAQIQAVLDLHRLIKAEYPEIELVTHEQVAMPRGRKTDPTRPWATDVLPRVLAAWTDTEGDEMSQEQFDKLEKSARAASFVGAITNALQIEDLEGAKLLNDEFYAQFPDGRSGLPKDWAPPK